MSKNTFKNMYHLSSSVAQATHDKARLLAWASAWRHGPEAWGSSSFTYFLYSFWSLGNRSQRTRSIFVASTRSFLVAMKRSRRPPLAGCWGSNGIRIVLPLPSLRRHRKCPCGGRGRMGVRRRPAHNTWPRALGTKSPAIGQRTWTSVTDPTNVATGKLPSVP